MTVYEIQDKHGIQEAQTRDTEIAEAYSKLGYTVFARQ